MSDVVTQLAAYRATLDDLAPEITLGELESSVGIPTRSRFRLRPITVVLVAALAVLVLIGGSALLFTGEGTTPPATDLPPLPTTVVEPESEATESADPDEAPADSVGAASTEPSDAGSAYDWLVGVVLETADTLELQPVVIAPDPMVYRTPSKALGLLAGTSVNLASGQDLIPEHEFGFELYLFETPEAASAHLAARIEGITPDSGAPAIPAGDESFPGGPCGRGCPLGQFVRSGSLLIEVKLPFEEERLDLAVTSINAVISAAATDDGPVVEVVDALRSEIGPDLRSESQIWGYNGPDDEDWEAAFSWTVSHGADGGPREPVCTFEMRGTRVNDTSYTYGILPDRTIVKEPFPIGGGTRLAEEDGGYQETLQMCDQYAFSFLEEWGLAEIVALNTGYPALVDIVVLEGGNYSAVAGSWHFVLDDLAALPRGFGQDESLTISDVRVHTDGSRRDVESVDFTVQGPTSALEQALGISIPETIQSPNPIIRIFTNEGP